MKAQLYQGKLKNEIAQEAFDKFGLDAPKSSIDKHFRQYGLKRCEKGMYYAVKAAIKNGRPSIATVIQDRLTQKVNSDVATVIRKVKTLADEVGGLEKLEELVTLLKR